MKLDPKRRATAEKWILKFLDLLDPSKSNSKQMAEVFKTMDDERFNRLRDGIPIFNPAGGLIDIDYKRNIALGEAIGVVLEQRVWFTDKTNGLQYRTRNPILTLPFPVRPQTQSWEKKVSVSEHSKVRDKLSGQVTGPSKTSSFSLSEVSNVYVDGLENSISEFLHARGGNQKLQRAFYAQVREQGTGKINIPGAERTSAKAPQTWANYIKAMGLGTNIGRPQ